jgi:DNA adenine methylase
MTVFLKWCGNKTRYLPQVFSRFPENFRNYHEPFLGSGSVYFEARKRGLLLTKTAYLSDRNYELIAVFLAIQDPDRLEKFLEKVWEYRLKHSPAFSREIKKQTFATLEEVAARFIYLNRVCFSGIYRLNDSGHFNTPDKKGKIHWIDDRVFESASLALQDKGSVKIFSTDYTNCLNYTEPGDFVYLDPPYASGMKFGKSALYASRNWQERDFVKLWETYTGLTEKGVKVLLSNSNSPIIFEYFGHQNITEFPVTYNPNGKYSVDTSELLISNY